MTTNSFGQAARTFRQERAGNTGFRLRGLRVLIILCGFPMYFTYVLKSIDHNKLYKGHTDNLPRRIIQHNNGKTSSTRPFLPYELVYYEVFETRNEAVSRKRYFESAAGRKFLKKKLSELGF